MITAEEKRKYVRQVMLHDVGLEGQSRIATTRVAIVGCGGLGCPVALYLAASGVRTLGIIDFDIVSITNLHRQTLFGDADVGRKKVEVAAEKITALHSGCTIEKHDVMLAEENAHEILRQYDIVVDGCDNFATRYITNDACVALNKPLVYGSILDFQGQVAVFNYGNGKNLRDIFPEPPDPDDVPDCSENGVLATVPGIIGTMLAHECLKVILGIAEKSGMYRIIDTRQPAISTFSF